MILFRDLEESKIISKPRASGDDPKLSMGMVDAAM